MALEKIPQPLGLHAPGDGNLAVPGTWEMQGADAPCLRGAEGRAAPRMLRLLSVEPDRLVVQEAG